MVSGRFFRLLRETNRPNQTMNPAAPLRCNFRVFAAFIAVIAATDGTVICAQDSRMLYNTEKKRLAIYAPRPSYGRGWPEGTGIFLLQVEKTGVVTSVTAFKSTGNKMLDNSAVETLKRWRFQPGRAQEIKVPITFEHWEHFKQHNPNA